METTGTETAPAVALTAEPTPLFGLVRELSKEFRTFIQQEIQLAKTEFSEKLSRLSRNAIALAVGGALAYAGLIVFLLGLGWLLAWVFELAGLRPLFAAFLGMAVLGLVVVVVGCAFLLKGIKTFSKESLTPQRTLHTLQELKSQGASITQLEGAQTGAASSAEMETRVQETETRMSETLDELGRRLSPQHLNRQVKAKIQANPYQSGLIAIGAGLLSGLYLTRKKQRG